jgi:hypothetical protein
VRKPLVVLAAVTAAALFAGHGSSSPRPRPLQLRGLAATHSLLAFRWTRDSGYLARVRATTLQPLRGKQMMISGQSSGWSFSPDRRQLALGDTSGGGEIWLVDTRRLKLAGRLSTGNYGLSSRPRGPETVSSPSSTSAATEKPLPASSPSPSWI